MLKNRYGWIDELSGGIGSSICLSYKWWNS